DIYPSLERACLEGTRLQSKYAISVIAALSGTSGDLAFSNLYEKLVDSLHAGQKMSTALQSLGCIAQYSLSVFGSREKEIIDIIQTIFREHHVHSVDDLNLLDEDFGCSTSCRLKVRVREKQMV
ncbi:sister chromatid cohesion protein PDS5-like protein, partial [Thalictrum thalictroides]